MASRRLLVHIVGEADLLLDLSPNSDSEHENKKEWREKRAERIEACRKVLKEALGDSDLVDRVRQLLAEGAWQDNFLSTPAPSPLFGVLNTIKSTAEPTPDLELLVIGTKQNPLHPLDTLPIAQTLVDVLNAVAAADASFPIRKATVVPVAGQIEEPVVEALTPHLDQAWRYQQGLVTWGSGATALSMGVLTA